MNSTEWVYQPLVHGNIAGWIMRAAVKFAGRPEPSEEDTFELVSPIRLLADVIVITSLLRERPNLFSEDDVPLTAVIRRVGDDFRKKVKI